MEIDRFRKQRWRFHDAQDLATVRRALEAVKEHLQQQSVNHADDGCVNGAGEPAAKLAY